MEHGNLVGKTALIDVMGMFMENMMMNTIELPVWPILRKAGYLSNLVEKNKLNTFLQHIRLA